MKLVNHTVELVISVVPHVQAHRDETRDGVHRPWLSLDNTNCCEASKAPGNLSDCYDQLRCVV